MKAIKITGAVRDLDIENAPAAFRCALAGHFLGVTHREGWALIYDKEAQLNGAERNEIASLAAQEVIYGSALVVGETDDDYCDVPENIAKSFLDLYEAIKW